MPRGCLLDAVVAFCVSCGAMVRGGVRCRGSKRVRGDDVHCQHSLGIVAWVLLSCGCLAQALIRLV